MSNEAEHNKRLVSESMAFMASVIKIGQGWSEQCEHIYERAQEALNAAPSVEAGAVPVLEVTGRADSPGYVIACEINGHGSCLGQQYYATPTTPASADPLQELDEYDAGLLNDFGGGDVSWWHDYIRAELGRAHEFYESQLSVHPCKPEPANQSWDEYAFGVANGLWALPEMPKKELVDLIRRTVIDAMIYASAGGLDKEKLVAALNRVAGTKHSFLALEENDRNIANNLLEFIERGEFDLKQGGAQ